MRRSVAWILKVKKRLLHDSKKKNLKGAMTKGPQRESNELLPQDIAISQKKSDDETPNANKDTSKKLGNKPSEKLSTESNVEQLSKPTVV